MSAAVSVAVPAAAQTLSPSLPEEAACLTPPESERGTPLYPEDMLKARDSASITVEYKFKSPDAPPEVRVIDGNESKSFTSSVKAFAGRLRLPCMTADKPVTLKYRYQFVPNDGRKVSWVSSLSGEDAERALRLRRCMVLPPRTATKYPQEALMREIQGVVLVDLTFNSKGAPPEAKFLFDGGHPSFRRAVLPAIEKIRVSCLDDAPFTTRIEWIFKIEEGSRAWLKDVDLMKFLSSVKGIREQHVYFDFNTMNCPFEVAFDLRQPYAANHVGVVGEPVPEREGFLAWLERMDLEIGDPETRRLVMANTSRIRVPCGALDL